MEGRRSHHAIGTPGHQRTGPWPVLRELFQHILVPHCLAAKEAQGPLGTSPQPKGGREKEVHAGGEGNGTGKARSSLLHVLGSDAPLLVLKGIWGNHGAYRNCCFP